MAKGDSARNIEDLSHLAVSEDEEIELSPEDVEMVEGGEGLIRSTKESRVSTSHKDRNDDKILGVPDRSVSKLSTEKQEWDQANIAAMAEKESKATDALDDRKVFGVFDGVSAGGAGVLASRIASGTIAERMAALPKEADAETSRMAIVDAIKAAHAAVLRYRQDRPDLKNMSATADIVRAIDNKDGTFDLPYGHVGDSRIYLFDPKSGELQRQTEDESLASIFHRGGVIEQEGMRQEVAGGQITAEELEKVMADGSLDAINNNTAKGMLKMMRNPLMNAIGFPRPEIAVKSGVIKAKAGQRAYVLTDGVHGALKESQIAVVLRAGGGQKELMDAASKSREEKKSYDDISIVEIGFESAADAAKPAVRETAELRRDIRDARAEASALEALLARADGGDVEALTKVKDKYEGRENVHDIILGMKSRAISREERLLKSEGGPGKDARLAEIAKEKEKLKADMDKQIERHRKAIFDIGADAPVKPPQESPLASSISAKKKPFWKKILGE